MMEQTSPSRQSKGSSRSGSQRLDTSDEEYYSDASEEGKRHEAPQIPITRIEKVDDEPRHGEIPGTFAHDMRVEDAVPDEVEVVAENSASETSSDLPNTKHSRHGDGSVPVTVVEKVDVHEKRHGEVPGTVAHDLRKADAAPDIVREAPTSARSDLEGSPTSPKHRSNGVPSSTSTMKGDASSHAAGEDGTDEFNEFKVGSDGEEGEDDDFGAFDEGAEEQIAALPDTSGFNRTVDASKFNSMRIFDFDGLVNLHDIINASSPVLGELFANLPHSQTETGEHLPEVNASFLTERSQSLWEQLVALPPLQPPDWIRSRIRRLFLVSLGVPVDLDEILPASKQKKLVLPSTDVGRDRSLSQSTEPRSNGTSESIKNGKTPSNPQEHGGSKVERRRRGMNPSPDLDLNAARLLSSTTEAALSIFTDSELRAHVAALESLRERANKLLEFWVIQKDSALGDKAAFEEVIENLVKHAKKIRK